MAPDARNVRDQQILTFLERSGWGGARRTPLAGDASFRRYERLWQGRDSAVLMDAPPDKETVAPFIKVARFLEANGFSTPKIMAEDEALGLLLLEDLGDALFSRILNDHPEQEKPLYLAAMEALIALHSIRELPDFPLYDRALLMQETMLFADWYLPAMLGKPRADELKEEFRQLWETLLDGLPPMPQVVVLRDFHADNLLWLPHRKKTSRIGLLDFQDAAIGSPAYDVVSFLEDARRTVSPETQKLVTDAYLWEAAIDREAFLLSCAAIAAQRNAKIIGVFTRLAARDGKLHYPKMIPHVWGLLERDVTHPGLKAVQQWLDTHLPAEMRQLVPQVVAQ